MAFFAAPTPGRIMCEALFNTSISSVISKLEPILFNANINEARFEPIESTIATLLLTTKVCPWLMGRQWL